jgi:hypothetical protein
MREHRLLEAGNKRAGKSRLFQQLVVSDLDGFAAHKIEKLYGLFNKTVLGYPPRFPRGINTGGKLRIGVIFPRVAQRHFNYVQHEAARFPDALVRPCGLYSLSHFSSSIKTSNSATLCAHLIPRFTAT